MGILTSISWCDSSLQLEVGCDGCELYSPKSAVNHCYAAALVGRYGGKGKKGWPESFDKPALFLDRIDKALKWPDLTDKPRANKSWLNGLPRMIFLCDLGDPFTESLPVNWLEPLLPKLAGSPHTWMLLTKRPSRFRQFAEKCGPLPRNIWGGVTVTTQATAKRIDNLLKIDVAKRFVSAEPLLGPLDLASYLGRQIGPSLDLVIVG